MGATSLRRAWSKQMKPTIKTSGFAGLEEALIELEKFTGRTHTGKNAVRRRMRNAMKRVEERAKALAPVDDGELRESIKTKNAKAKQIRGLGEEGNLVVLTGPTSVKGGGPQLFQEFGTVNMPANPFMRPAGDSEGPKVVDYVTDVLRTEIDKSVARARKKAARGK